MSLKIRRLSHALGAEILGVDIRKPLDDKTFGQVHAAFLEHYVLLFRGQALTREQHVAFSRRFGELSNNDEAPKARAPGYPELQRQVNMPTPPGQRPIQREAMLWHSDRTFMCNTATATALRAVEIPDVGGDTLFANMYLAYETLSDGMKKLIEGLYGVHPGAGGIIDNSTPERLAETKRLSRPIAHPLARGQHPETGRKALFVGEKIKQFAGMTAEESEPLLDFLCKHATRPQYVYRHQWQKDDLLMWDNRCTVHKALYDYDQTQMRHLEKTTGITGSPSGGVVYDGPVDDSISIREAIWRKRQA